MTDIAAPAPNERPLMAFVYLIGAILAVGGLVAGVVFLTDKNAAPNLLANIQDFLGNTAEATALRRGGGDRALAKVLLAIVALVVGVGGIWLFYAGLNAIVELLTAPWRRRILPWVFVGPALVLLTLYLVLPAVLTTITSLTEGAGLGNYEWALTSPPMQKMIGNNIIWLIVGTAGAVGLGLLIAAMLDRVRFEAS